jgi:hypothetical protein
LNLPIKPQEKQRLDYEIEPPREPMTLKWVIIRNVCLLASAIVSIWLISLFIDWIF